MTTNCGYVPIRVTKGNTLNPTLIGHGTDQHWTGTDPPIEGDPVEEDPVLDLNS